MWDLLRFHVGVDVADTSSIEGQPAQLNVRGLPSEFSQSLQVLIDGRSVVSAAKWMGRSSPPWAAACAMLTM